MTSLVPEAPKEGPAATLGDAIAGLEPLTPVVRRWPSILAGLLTIAMVVGLGVQLLHKGLHLLLKASLQGFAHTLSQVC